MLYGPDGKPALITEPIPLPILAPFKVTRQLRRAYLRQCAIASVNQKAGGEDRRIRRAMARDLSKRPAFIEEVKKATHAF